MPQKLVEQERKTSSIVNNLLLESCSFVLRRFSLGPTCRLRTNLINNSIDSLPGNYIVRDIIERQYGTATPERPPGYAQQIQDRIQRMKKEEEGEGFDWDKYVKPAVAALFGVLGGLLLAKGVKKMTDNNNNKK